MNKKRKKIILLIEDDDPIAVAYERGFSRAGFKMFRMSNGENVIEGIRKYEPDIIILDLIMPKKNGFEVLKELSLNNYFSKIPVIVATNLEEDFYLNSIQDYPVTEIIIKSSISLSDIVEKVKDIIKNFQSV